MSQSISNHTHACLFPSTPQRSEIVSTMGRPHPPLRSERGLGSEGIPKPGPGSHTLPRTASSETVTVREICSSGESPAWRMLLVTSSLTTSRTSSSFSGGKRSVSWSRAWRAVVTTSGSGSSLRSISAIIKKPQQISQHCKRYVPSVTCRYTSHGCAAAQLAKTEAYTLDWLRLLATVNYSDVGLQLTEVGMPDRSRQGSLSIHRQNERWLREQALAASRAAIVITDPNEPGNTIVYANPTFERITGYSIEEAIGKNCRFLQGEDRDQPALEELRAAIREGRDCQIILRNYKKDGTLFWNELSISPVHDEEGNLSNFVGVLGDVTERKWAEEALQYQLDLTRTITDNAADSLFLWDTEGRVTFMNPAAEQTFGWRQEELFGEVLHDRMHHHYPDGRPYPISECPLVRVFESAQTLRDHEDVFYRKDGSAVDVACSHAPIVVDGRITGAVLVVRDITERKQNEEAQQFLAEASASLSSSLDYRATLARVARLAVPYLADWCAIDILEEDGSLDRLALTHQDPDKVALAQELEERYPPDPEAQRGVSQVLRTAQSELGPKIPESLLEETVQDTRHREILRELGLKSYIIVPLVARGRTLGAITLVSAESGRRYGTAELELAKELARRAALDVDNARLYSGRSEIARTLQESLLPSRLPEVPGVEVGLRSLPAGEVEVGGDFYDLFDARVNGEAGSSEPSSSWAVVIGDVCGKGAEAAAMLALARHTIRAVAMREIRPSAILAALNEVKRRQRYERDSYKFCTIAYARLETSEEGTERGARIIVSCGGHSAPILLKSDGSIHKIVCSGRALGVFDDANLTDQEAHLAPGDTLLLYTDGVTEARAPDGTFYGEERLASLLRSSVGLDASTLASHIESAVLDFQENDPRDDVAVLVLRVSD